MLKFEIQIKNACKRNVPTKHMESCILHMTAKNIKHETDLVLYSNEKKL